MDKRKRGLHPSCGAMQARADDPDPSPEDVYRAARAYTKSGLSLVPITADGEKRPAWMLMTPVWSEENEKWTYPWCPYKSRIPRRDELRNWFDPADEREFGLAIIGGAVSGGLEIIDCDNWHVAERWLKLVKKQSPVLIDKLVLVRSPRPGLHAYYRCEEFGGNEKLARVPDPEKDNKKPKTIIEVKGEGGYCVAPPSPAACHKTGRCYTFWGDKDLTEIPTISLREREVLLDCARKLNAWVEPERPAFSPRRRRSQDGILLRPGDDFNWRGDWAEILEPHGWKWVRRSCDGSDQWRRPGKTEGTSATTNYAGSDLLFVFSANADPFDEWTAYTKFHVYTLLDHQGDFTQAARTLARRGYGTARGRGSQKSDPYRRYAGYTLRSRYFTK